MRAGFRSPLLRYYVCVFSDLFSYSSCASDLVSNLTMFLGCRMAPLKNQTVWIVRFVLGQE